MYATAGRSVGATTTCASVSQVGVKLYRGFVRSVTKYDKLRSNPLVYKMSTPTTIEHFIWWQKFDP
jgi:hypothetical protein